MIEGLDNMAQSQWTVLYRHFTHHLNNATTRYFGTLMKSSNTGFPLPGLETVHLFACKFTPENGDLFQALKDLHYRGSSRGA